MLRGLVIVVMAIDHVRDFFNFGGEPDPMVNPGIGAGLFFTRWITHFCAPVFVFLAGTSAGLMTSRKTQSALGAFLFKRGVWLILIEWFVVATAWSFAPWGIEQLDGRVGVVLGVIWAIGASMVVLAGAQFLGQRVCLIIGGAILVGHNLLDPIWPATSGVFDTGHPLWVGPAAILCASADRVPDAIKRPLIVFGRAPFAFYVAHLYLIHALAVAFGVIQGFDAREFLTYSFFFPKGYGVGLPITYAVWLLVIATLYPLCKWVAAVKGRRQDWWLSYL